MFALKKKVDLKRISKAIKGRLVPPPTRQAVRCSSQGVSMQPFSGEQAGECTVLQGPASQCSNMALEEHS